MLARPFHVLLVEDNSAHAKLATMAIRGAPVAATVHRVVDGEEAWGYLLRQPPHAERPDVDLILLDLVAPRISGLELLRRIKQTQELQCIPVVVLSSAATDSQVGSAYQERANSLLIKPMEFEVFQRMMTDLLVYWGQWNQRA